MIINEMDDEQRLHSVNSRQLYGQWLAAYREALSYQRPLRWSERSDGKAYLVRPTGSNGSTRSLGPKNEKTIAIYDQFHAAKERSKERYASLSAQLERQSRLNKALGLDRLSSQATKLLRALNLSGATNDLLIVGTHALFAYESKAGIFYQKGALATKDIDLLFDRRKSITLLAEKLPKQQIMGLLQAADKTYRPVAKRGGFRAINDQGFMVDFITSTVDIRKAQNVQLHEDDLVAGEVPNIHWLINAPKFESTLIGTGGQAVTMVVPDPRAFALHKAWLSQRVDRDPVKKPRDLMQAKLVARTVLQYFPNLPFEARALRYMTALGIADSVEKIIGQTEAFEFGLPSVDDIFGDDKGVMDALHEQVRRKIESHGRHRDRERQVW